MKLVLRLLISFLLPGSITATELPILTPVFKVSFAEKDISHDIGMEAPGGYGKSYHRTFHDPCKVRAVVFDDGKKGVALVGIDLLFVTRSLVEEALAEIEKRCGLPQDNIMIGVFHSHSYGPIGMREPSNFKIAVPLGHEFNCRPS